MDITTKDKWFCCTDGEKIFHIVENVEGSFTSTGQKNIITADSDKELLEKIYKNVPEDAVIEDLEAKFKTDIAKVMTKL